MQSGLLVESREDFYSQQGLRRDSRAQKRRGCAAAMSSPELFAARLEGLLGPERVHSEDAAVAGFGVNGLFPVTVVCPGSAEELVQMVRFAREEKLQLIAHGSRSKSDIGMPPAQYDIAVDMSDIREIDHYDAGDLTLSVDAGMPLRELAARLTEQ